MAGNVGFLNIGIGANTAQLKRGLAHAGNLVKGFAGGIAKGVVGIGSSISRIGSGLVSGLAPLAAAVGAGGLTAGIVSASSSIDQLGKSADSLGIGTEELIALRHAGDLAGVGAEDLDTSLGKMLKTIGSAESGNAAATSSIENLGLSISSLQGLSANEQFGMIADAINSFEDPALRTAAAMQIFGRGAMQLMPLLMGGSSGIRSAADETVRLGMAFSRVDAAKVEGMNDAFSRLKSAVAGVFQKIAIELAPVMETTFTKAAFWVADVGSSIAKFVATGVKEITFFISTWDLQWELIKNSAATALDYLKDYAIATYTAIGGATDALAKLIGNNLLGEILNVATGGLVKIDMQDIRDIGAAAAKSFADGLGNSLDPALSAERSKIKSAIDAARRKFDEPSGAAGAAAMAGAKLGAGLGIKQKAFGGAAAAAMAAAQLGVAATSLIPDATKVSHQFASATQFGTSEGVQQIFGAISAKAGSDDRVASNTEETAKNTERIALAVEKMQPADLDMVDSFLGA